MKIRRAGIGDVDFMWTILYYASHADEDGVCPEDIRVDSDLSRYLCDWPRQGDMGVVAESVGGPLGAAWVRLLLENERDQPTYLAPGIPELAIAVLPGYEGRGIGTALLEELFDTAIGEYPAIVLSVREGNPAERLYRRAGFVETSRMVNRVGTSSVVMVRTLT